MNPVLYLVIPCYNEEEALPKTNSLFLNKINQLVAENEISEKSRVLFVNDGSSDKTWDIICALSKENPVFQGICLNRNRGHQNALLAGLFEAKEHADITISMDCDGQDDVNAVDRMVADYKEGYDIVYGVRDDRSTDSFFKRFTAESFYKLLKACGAETVFNHADYRLMSKRALEELSKYEEVNLYLRGMVPLVGYKSSQVTYKRHERVAGKTHYPLKKMLKLAMDGITSLSVKPIHIVTTAGFIVALISFIGVIWSVVTSLCGNSVPGWASMTCIICFLGGIQLLSLGMIGEYIGKIYLEVKHRPRFAVSEKTEELHDEE